MQDQTGETKITLLDSVAKSIVKTSAAKVVNVLLDEVICYLFFYKFTILIFVY